MALLRTRQLCVHALSAANASDLIFTAQPGTRAVVRDVVVYNTSAARDVSRCILYAQSGVPSGSVVAALLDGPLTALQVVRIQLDLVLEHGDSLSLFGTAIGPHVWISGAVLDLPP